MSIAKTSLSDAASFPPSVLRGDHDRHSHVVQFYAEDEALLDGLSQFIGTALGAGDAAVVIASEAHRDRLAKRLKARGLDLAVLVKRGRYIPLDARETLSKFMLDGWPDPVRFAEVIGSVMTRARKAAEGPNSSVAGFGEMVALLWTDGKFEAAIRLERLWNELIKTHSFSLLCAYPMASFDRHEHSEPFLRICASHSGVIPGETYTALTSEDERLRNITHLQQKAQTLENEIAERKDAQKVLKRREAELADLLENSLEGVQQTGPDQKILWANKALLKLLGYSAGDYFGRHLSEFFVSKRDLQAFWTKLMQREEIYDFPAEVICKDGSVKRVLIHSNGLWEGERFVHTRTFIRDVTERSEMERALKQAHDELEARINDRTAELRQKNLQVVRQAEMLQLTNQGLRDLSARLFHVQDEERRRIARDLHDSTGQSLALLSMNLTAMEMEAEKISPNFAKGLSENAEIVRQISTELRTISYLLHPPLIEEMGLEAAIRWYIDGFAQRSNINIKLDFPGGLERMFPETEIAIFRVVQECLTNIHRHSESPTAIIRLYQSSGKVTLEVIDEGKGIAPDKLSQIAASGSMGVGIRGMQERIKDLGGELEISSSKKGTQIKIVIPMAAAPSESQFPEARNNIQR